MRVLIVDDEAPARRKLKRFAGAIGDWEIVGEARSVASAVSMIQSVSPDLVLLDIQLGDGTGFDVIEQIGAAGMPSVVFTTAYDEFALRAFEVAAQDYLLKPISQARFEQMAQRLSQLPAPSRTALQQVLNALRTPQYERRLVVKSDAERAHFVQCDSIIVISADRNYVGLTTTQGQYRMRSTLAELLARLDPATFAQTNRSTAVNLDHVREIQPWFRGQRLLLMADGTEVKVSRKFAEQHPALREAL